MTNRGLITLHALTYAIFGIVLFLLPDLLWPLYGVEINDRYARFLSQHTSIFLGGVAILAWMLRDSDAATSQKVVKGLMWTNILGVIITLYAALTGVFTGFGWSDPVIFGALAAWCFLQLRKA